MASIQQKVMVRPSNVIHGFKVKHEKVSIWLTHDNNTHYEGFIIGYDEFLNFVVDEVVEVNTKTSKTTELGRILLKGENVALIHAIGV
jgi:small nuclear ribonucleoprotein E